MGLDDEDKTFEGERDDLEGEVMGLEEEVGVEI